MTKKVRARVSARLAHARATLARLRASARYWAKDARRCGPEGLMSFLISDQDRWLARGWQAEVNRLEFALRPSAENRARAERTGMVAS